jgi:cation diffusion facilitator family transporter
MPGSMADGASPHLQRLRAMRTACLIESASFLLNLTGALLANSLTLWTNTLRVGLDTMVSMFALYVTLRIVRGKDDRFDYGLGKWENLSAFLNSAVMLAGLLFIGVEAIRRIVRPQDVSGTGFGEIVLIFFLSLNVWLFMKFRRLRKTDPSPVVDAQFVLYRNAVAASIISPIAVLFSDSVESKWLATLFDTAGVVVLSAFILYGMIGLMRKSLAALTDETLEEALQLRIIRGLVEHMADYRQIHRVRTRRSGNHIFIELFLEFDPVLPVRDVLDRSARIKGVVENLIPHSEAWIVPCGTEATSRAGGS